MVVLSAIGVSSLFAMILRPTWAHHRAVTMIKELGDNVVVHYDSPDYSLDATNCRRYPRWLRDTFGDDLFYSVWSIEIHDADLTKIDLAPLSSLRHLDDIYIHNAKLTNEGFKRLMGLPCLASLSLDGSNITDTMLAGSGGSAGAQSQVELLSLRRTMITDSGMTFLVAFKRLRSLYLDNTSITDAGLANLRNLRDIETLSLSGDKITDRGLELLECLTKINELNLSRTEITDAGVKHVATLRRLERIDLGETSIGDETLKGLAGIKGLRDLAIDHTKVTDEGVAYLIGLDKLEYIHLDGTKVSKEAIGGLQKAMPKVSIISAMGE